MIISPKSETGSWPLRPWILATLGACGGLAFHFLTDHKYPASLSIDRQIGATFVAIATLAFLLTVERLRWTWSVVFAIGWGAIMALVGWSTASYNYDPTIFEFPYWAGMLAVMIAAPLFQTARDEGAWRFPYADLHRHAWSDAVIGAAALLFTGVTFLLGWLIAGLFHTIDIEFPKKLMEKLWFEWTLSGFAFGAAIGLLRERETLLLTLQRLVRIILSVLAPVLAAALVLFLLSIPFKGPQPLWKSQYATPLLLLASAGAVSLVNAVIGDGRDDRQPNRILHYAALALVACVLPLALIAAFSMAQRVGQYGWTPERMWGFVAIGTAIAYGLAGAWSIATGRLDFDDRLRPLQIRLAQALCVVALLLALPIIDFGKISADSQLARLHHGKVTPDAFDWTAMALEFGPAGRRALGELARHGSAIEKTSAAAALATKSRYDLKNIAAGPPPKMLIVAGGGAVPEELRVQLLGGAGVDSPFCSEGGSCRVYPQPSGQSFVVLHDGCANLPKDKQVEPGHDCTISPAVFELRGGKWVNVYDSSEANFAAIEMPVKRQAESLRQEREALETGDVRIVTVERRQVQIGGKARGNIFP